MSEQIREAEKNARFFLDSKNINWQLGLEIFNLLPIESEFRKEIIARVIELKPQLVKRLKIDDQSGDLEEISKRHHFVIDDYQSKPLNYFNVPLIKNSKELDFQVFEILASLGFIKKISLNSRSKVFGFGSCFAINLVNFIKNKGIDAQSAVISEEINSPRNNLALLKWIIKKENNFVSSQLPLLNSDFSTQIFEESLKNSSHIIFTLGSAFSLIHSENKGQHLIFSLATITEIDDLEVIRKNIEEIIFLIKGVNPEAIIILTVSPVPIRGIAHNENPIVANMQSKSILRALVSEVCKTHAEVYYLPIFDIVIGLAPYIDRVIFGKDDGNARHLDGWVIDSIMRQFFSLIVK